MSDVKGSPVETTADFDEPIENAFSKDNPDPYSPYNIGILQFIMLGRIYDVLLTALTDSNPEAAKQVLDIHRSGNLMGPPPNFTGAFIEEPTATES